MPESLPPSGVTVTCPLRWGDMDTLGHVNNTIYFQFCEEARIAYFHAVGLDDFKERPTDGPGMVACNLNFRRQLRYPGTVTVAGNVTQIKQRSFTLAYKIVDTADGQVVADGGSVCVWVDYAAGRAMDLPQRLVERIAELERNPDLRATS